MMIYQSSLYIYDTIHLLRQRAGAIALLVIDEGQCKKYDQRCLPGANKLSKEGFGILDLKSHW
jgi:hypothetical protein